MGRLGNGFRDARINALFQGIKEARGIFKENSHDFPKQFFIPVNSFKQFLPGKSFIIITGGVILLHNSYKSDNFRVYGKVYNDAIGKARIQNYTIFTIY